MLKKLAWLSALCLLVVPASIRPATSAPTPGTSNRWSTLIWEVRDGSFVVVDYSQTPWKPSPRDMLIANFARSLHAVHVKVRLSNGRVCSADVAPGEGLVPDDDSGATVVEVIVSSPGEGFAFVAMAQLERRVSKQRLVSVPPIHPPWSKRASAVGPR